MEAATTTEIVNTTLHLGWTMHLVLIGFTAYLSMLAYKNYRQAKNLE